MEVGKTMPFCGGVLEEGFIRSRESILPSNEVLIQGFIISYKFILVTFGASETDSKFI